MSIDYVDAYERIKGGPIPPALAEHVEVVRAEWQRRWDARGSARSTKIGRNDPCPCGSGKKYKKCCDGTVVPG